MTFVMWVVRWLQVAYGAQLVVLVMYQYDYWSRGMQRCRCRLGTDGLDQALAYPFCGPFVLFVADVWSLVAAGLHALGFLVIAVSMVSLGSCVVATIKEVPFNVEIRRRKVYEVRVTRTTRIRRRY